jgi:hypothetical protein
MPPLRVSRDTILFVTGLGGLAYETFTVHAEKPTLIIAFAAMLGLPLFIRSDEARKEQAKDILDHTPPKDETP